MAQVADIDHDFYFGDRFLSENIRSGHNKRTIAYCARTLYFPLLIV